MEPLLPGAIYHIYNHANGDDILFREEENYRYFLQQYQKHITPVATTLAWCLMPNHFHLLVKIKPLDELKAFANHPGFKNLDGLDLNNLDGLELIKKKTSKQFSNLFNGYSKAINKRYKRRGSLFIKNFNREIIESDTYFGQVMAYIHLNPIKHGFVNNIKEWPWTSYHDYTGNQQSFTDKKHALKWYGTLQHFKDCHDLFCNEMISKRNGSIINNNQ